MTNSLQLTESDTSSPSSPVKLALIGGSGLGVALGSASAGSGQSTRHEIDTPFGKPSDAIIETSWDGLTVFLLSRHGPGHMLNPSQVPYRANIFALKQLGCTHIIASGAVGGLREEFRPRDLVVPDQVIDRTFRRAGTFFEQAAVHVEFAEPFCPVLRQTVLEAARLELQPEASDQPPAFRVHERGCYVCMEGPAFSTRAESVMHRLFGGDLIGMTAMPEAKLAREAEISYALLALVTDYDCWRQKPATTPPGTSPPAGAPPVDSGASAANPAALLEEILGNLRAASDNAMRVIRRAVKLLASGPHRPSPAAQALKLAIWSDKSRIPASEVQRLAPLWMKYFEAE